MHHIKINFPPNLYVGTKSELVAEAIRTAILIGDILPGSKISEQQVMNTLKVSSSPVREAFNHLKAEGLLTQTANMGTTVTSMDVEDAKELYQIQTQLQAAAVQICSRKLKEEDIAEAERLNNELKTMVRKKMDLKSRRVINYKFHMLLCGMNIYPWLTRLISALWIRIPPQNIWLIPQRPMLIVQEHEKILNAVKKEDGISAGAAMKEHLQNSMTTLFENRVT